jgi:hypothetical protein
VEAIAARFHDLRGARLIGGFLAVVGVVLGGLWLFLAIRFAITGELMADIPIDGIHLVFAIDTSLLVPALVVTGDPALAAHRPRLRVRNSEAPYRTWVVSIKLYARFRGHGC